jgi:intein/homing endonuclease
MPSATNDIAFIANEFLSGKTQEFVDPVTFIESPWGLNIVLFPAQKFIIKCLYGMKLDDIPGAIKVPDIVNEHILYEFSEVEFLEWLYAEKRCNTNSVEGKIFRELVLSVGRRGSKSTLSACISNYELYRLVKKSNPSKAFGFPDDTEIVILNVAPTDEQAGVVFEMIQRQATRCPYLRDRCLHQTMSYFDLRTDSDMQLAGKPKASLISLAGGCSSNALRGRNAIVIIMDEMAFFIDNGGRFSGEEVYKALTPSVASFGDDGKVLLLSSPYAKYGKFWDRYNESFIEPDVTLMFKMYTPMLNPTIQPAILKAARRRDRVSFLGEYGGEFSDSVVAWIDDESEFKKCIGPRQPMSHGIPDVEYYVGVDLGFKNDGTAIAIVHDDGKKIVLDYADVWFSGQSDVWEFNNSIYGGCRKYAAGELIKMEDIIVELKELHRWFPIKKGILDQHNGYALAEMLCKSGLKQFYMEHLTDLKITEIFQVVKTLYAEQLIDLYDHPVLIPEMLSLEAERKARDRIFVRKPNRRGAHDDLCLVPESLIVTRNGIKRIDDCVVGDSVLTHRGVYCSVENVSKRSVDEDIVEIRAVHLGTLKLTGNHPVYVLREGMKKFIPASDVTRKDKVIYTYNMGVRFPSELDMLDFVEKRDCKKNRAGLSLSDLVVENDCVRFVNGTSSPIRKRVAVTGDLCRLFGYYVAEGSTGNHGVSFGFAADETEYHADVENLMRIYFGLDKVVETLNKRGTGVQLDFNSFILKDVFGKLFGLGAGHKRVPSWMMEMPFDLQAEFLRGYWRGDGCYTNRSFVFTTTSIVLAHQIRDILLRLGVGSGIHDSRRKGKKHRFDGDRFYTMNYDLLNVRVQSLFDMVRMAEILGEEIPDADLKRCRNTSERVLRFGELYCGIRAITKTHYHGDVFNLTVPDDASYVTANGTVHNSDAFARAVWLCFQSRHGKPFNIAIGRGNGGMVGPSRHDGPMTTPAGFALQKLRMHGEHPRIPMGRHRRLAGMSVR